MTLEDWIKVLNDCGCPKRFRVSAKELDEIKSSIDEYWKEKELSGAVIYFYRGIYPMGDRVILRGTEFILEGAAT